MATLLHIDSSPLDSSISRELTREYVAGWKARNPEGTVVVRDVAKGPSKPVDQAWVFAAYTPEDKLTAEQKAVLADSEELIAELKAADEVVIGVAMHNFGVPSTLKLWIDQVTRRGKTFQYDANGVEGLLKGKKATVLIATGGVYEAGSPMAGYNFVEPYLSALLGFLGFTDVRFVTAGGVSQVLTGAVDRTEFLKPALEKVRGLAA